MLPKHNAPGRSLAREIEGASRAADGSRHHEAVDEAPCVSAARRSIDVIFDLDAPGASEKLEAHRAGLGDDYHEVEPLRDGRVVLRMFPGGARRPL